MTAKRAGFRLGVTYQLALFILLVFLIVLFGVIQPVFFYPDVLFNVTAIIGEIGIMALAMTFIITTGGIDLSVGYILQLCAIVFGSIYARTHNVSRRRARWRCVCGIACGLLNGIIISRTKIPPLVTTLATMNLYRGISMIVAGSETYSGFPASFKAISSTFLFGIVPIQFIYLLVLFLLFNLFYTRGTLGRSLKGIGFNENVLVFSGINTKRTLLFIYTLAGLMCALASLVYLGRLSAATTSMGNDLNLQVITAVVLGGTSIMGGIGQHHGDIHRDAHHRRAAKGLHAAQLQREHLQFHPRRHPHHRPHCLRPAGGAEEDAEPRKGLRDAGKGPRPALQTRTISIPFSRRRETSAGSASFVVMMRDALSTAQSVRCPFMPNFESSARMIELLGVIDHRALHLDQPRLRVRQHGVRDSLDSHERLRRVVVGERVGAEIVQDELRVRVDGPLRKDHRAA